MEKMSSEIKKSLDALVDYNFSEEQAHYEEENDCEITDDDYNNPDGLEDQNHIFYHILVISQWMNQ